MSRFWNKWNLALLILLAIGLGLRMWGVGQGLPSSYYPDERHFINRAMSFGTGDFNPHWFHKPALYMYLLFLEYGLFFLIGKAVGLFATLHDFARLYINDLSSFLLIGRTTTALFGTMTVWLTYHLGRRMHGHRLALVAAAFLAVTFAHVKGSQDIKEDVPAGFFALLSFIYIYSIFEHGRVRSYCLAGFFAGLGVATKYSPIVLLVPIVVAHLMFLHRQKPFPWSRLIDRRLLLSFVLLGVAFFLGSPYNFFDPYFARSQILPLFQRSSGLGTEGTVSFLWKYLGVLVNPVVHLARVILKPNGMGPVLGLVSLLGMVFLVLRGSRGDRLLAVAVISFVYISSFLFGSHLAARHLNVVFPFLVLGAATLVVAIMEWILSSRPKAFGVPGGIIVVLVPLLLAVPSTCQVVKFEKTISRKDSRTVAKEWVEKHIPAGSRILVDDYCVPLKMSPERVRELLMRAEREQDRGPFTAHAAVYYRYYLETVQEPTYYLNEISHPWWKEYQQDDGTFSLKSESDRDMGNPLKEWGVSSLAEYRAQGYEYFITTAELISKYLADKDSVDFPSFLRFYQEVHREAILLSSFDPSELKGPGPIVFIYRLRADN